MTWVFDGARDIGGRDMVAMTDPDVRRWAASGSANPTLCFTRTLKTTYFGDHAATASVDPLIRVFLVISTGDSNIGTYTAAIDSNGLSLC